LPASPTLHWRWDCERACKGGKLTKAQRGIAVQQGGWKAIAHIRAQDKASTGAHEHRTFLFYERDTSVDYITKETTMENSNELVVSPEPKYVRVFNEYVRALRRRKEAGESIRQVDVCAEIAMEVKDICIALHSMKKHRPDDLAVYYELTGKVPRGPRQPKVEVEREEIEMTEQEEPATVTSIFTDVVKLIDQLDGKDLQRRILLAASAFFDLDVVKKPDPIEAAKQRMEAAIFGTQGNGASVS